VLAVALSSIRRVPCAESGWFRVACAALALCSFTFIVLSASPAQAQNVVFSGVANSADAPKTNSAFQLPDQSNSFKESLDEFQRMVQHEQWEKAFAALDSIAKNTAPGFVNRGDGVLVPSRLLVRRLMSNLPSAGKTAYRLFYDPQATALWEAAQGRAELDKLATIVSQFAISSLGDRAADRLGDLQFERGDFEQAAAAWQTILDCSPDSQIPRVQTQVKIATALARAGRWNEFRDVESQVRGQYAEELVTLGGEQIAAAKVLDRLGQPAAVLAAPQAQQAVCEDFDLPAANQPSWRFPFQLRSAKSSSGGVARAVNVNGNFIRLVDRYGRERSNDFTIPAACDGKRVFVNVLGVEMGFDLATGKLLWRTGKLYPENQENQQQRQNVQPERYAIGVSGDVLWSLSREINDERGAFRLTFRDPATGEEKFTSRRTLSSWSFSGPPLFADDRIYAGAQRHGQGRELFVLVLDRSGKLQKSISIGNYAVDQNNINQDSVSRPTLSVYRNRLIVDSHAGAVVAVDPLSGIVDWGVLYESPAPDTGYYYNYAPRQYDVSGPLTVGGVLICKGMRSPRMVGIAAGGPEQLWTRPVMQSARLIAADEGRIYLGGDELTAYRLDTQELVWATPVPASVDWAMPVATRNRIYQFTSRGVCEVEKSDGKIVRVFRGDDLESLGGALLVTPSAIVTVSNVGITAYALGTDNPPQADGSRPTADAATADAATADSAAESANAAKPGGP